METCISADDHTQDIHTHTYTYTHMLMHDRLSTMTGFLAQIRTWMIS